jgi:hypothetical protein
MMTAWRMAFRCGINGFELWDACWRHKVAIIEYGPFDDIDLSLYPEDEPRSAWAQLKGSQSHSLKRFVYKMDKDDIIYVKKGPVIVAKGIVTGPYRFDKKNRIVDPHGTPWQHQHAVRWTRYIHEVPIQVGYAQNVTVVELDAKDVKRIEKAAQSLGN